MSHTALDERIAALKPGDAIFDKVWERIDPLSDNRASFLTQLFEAEFRVAALEEALRHVIAHIDSGVGIGGECFMSDVRNARKALAGK